MEQHHNQKSALLMVTYILNKIHSIISSVLYKIGMVFMSLMTLAVLIQVLMRYVFSSPISWIEEFCIYSMFLMTFLLAPYIALKKMNISMTLFYDRIKNIKAKMIINILLNLISIWGIYTVYPSMMEVVLNNINVTTTQMPLTKGQFYLIVPISFFMVITISIEQILADFHKTTKDSQRV